MMHRLLCTLGVGCLMVTGLQAQTRPEAPTHGEQVSTAVDVAPARLEVPETTGLSKSAGSQASNPLPVALAQQQQALSAQREAILALDAQQRVACWQKFAVNACLSEARRARRQALEPIRQQELLLNAQERAWRTAEREQRLQDKQTDPKDKP